jgi:hypothetical protein
MKQISLFFSIFLLLPFCSQIQKAEITFDLPVQSFDPNTKTRKTSEPIDKKKIVEAVKFCKKQNLDTTIAFFVDMSIHSGKKRFYVYDFQKKTVLNSGLCCHGMGLNSTQDSIVFSNETGSNCTSLGKYKTGIRAYSNWGINVHYKMHGLEKTNSNAFQRIIVLHSYDPVSEEEIYPENLPMGWSKGCPVISNKLMTSIDSLLKKKKIPVLLWIY